jgi:arginine deiminase
MRRAIPLVLAFLAAAPAVMAAATSAAAPGVVCDAAPLDTVIVLPPGPDLLRPTYLQYVNEPFGPLIYADGAIAQHADLVRLLRRDGVDVLSVQDLLQDAIDRARRAGEWDTLLREIFPEQSGRLAATGLTLDAAMLLGRNARLYYDYSPEGWLDPLVPQSPGFFYTRDFAVSLPRGVILTCSRSRHRRYEHALGRMMFRYAAALRDHPILFDAEKEDVRCEGGDIIVKDDHTLLMGLGNLSDREAAAAIARRTGMDVIGVAMPPLDEFSGANIQILHLDTVFNIVDRDKVLTVPYLFLRRYDGKNPLVRFLRSIQDRPQEKPRKGELVLPASLDRAIAAIPKVGWLTLFAAGTGAATDPGTKLGDYMMAQGYEIVPVGGEQGDMPEDQYINERVLYEMSLQGANVVQIGPGKVLAYAHNTHTNALLEKRGVRVVRFEGKYLADMQGGPHCLTMPLVRRWR